MDEELTKHELEVLNNYKELIYYVSDNVEFINKKDKNENNARKIGVCTDTLKNSYYVIEDFITNGLRGTEHKAFITLYALAQAIDISIQATMKLYEIIVRTTVNRNEIVSVELQEFIDEILNNIKLIDECDTSIILHIIDNNKYEINITSFKDNNFENKEIMYRQLILDYLKNQTKLKFVKHIIDKVKEFKKEFENE